jgi:hypothetical protein
LALPPEDRSPDRRQQSRSGLRGAKAKPTRCCYSPRSTPWWSATGRSSTTLTPRGYYYPSIRVARNRFTPLFRLCPGAEPRVAVASARRVTQCSRDARMQRVNANTRQETRREGRERPGFQGLDGRIPGHQDWLAEEAVSGEPVSRPEFPANRENNREYRGIRADRCLSRRKSPRYSNGLEANSLRVLNREFSEA